MWRIFAPFVVALLLAVALTSALSPHAGSASVNPPRAVSHAEAVVTRPGPAAASSPGAAVGTAAGWAVWARNAAAPAGFR
jgi:hypothetical protein